MLETSKELLKILEEKGFKAYIVGGFVRDYILNIDSVDVDICTNATPKELLEIFENAIPNEEYGSVKLNFKKINFEITTFRREIKYVDNRKPIEIDYIDSLSEDLKRRDITINTLCMNSDGEILDLLGAIKDLKNKIIKVVGNPYEKLEQDALRILRCIRFATKLNFRIDLKTKQAIKRNAKLLKNLSYERKKEELDKIFSSKNVKYGVQLIKKLGLDKYLEIENIRKIKLVDDLLGIWSQLDVLGIYQFTKNEEDQIIKINHLIDNKRDIYNDYIIYKYGAYITSIVAKIKNKDIKKINEIYENLDIYNRNEINIDGEDIIRILDKEPDKWVSEILKDVEKQIVYKKLENNEEKIKDYIIKKYK